MTNRGEVTTDANRLCRITMQVTSAELVRVRLQVCAYWRESWFRSSLSYLNMSFTQHTVLYTDVTFPDDLVACVHKSRTHMSRSHAQPWQRGISHLLGVKVAGVTQCKQNGHVAYAVSGEISSWRCLNKCERLGGHCSNLLISCTVSMVDLKGGIILIASQILKLKAWP